MKRVPMQIACEGHEQIRGLSQGIEQVLRAPEVLPEPVFVGDSDADFCGASIYGSVLRDGGLFRMWYQAWPRDWDGRDAMTVGCVESDDGLHWRRPQHGLVECNGSTANHLTDLPFHSPSVFVDPQASAQRRYRAFGHARPQAQHEVTESGYYTAYSPDGLHSQLDSPKPLWPHADVIISTWDADAHRALIAFKHNGLVAGMQRRRFFTATWADGQASEPISALFPDELDDLNARARGFASADYYGVGLMPTAGPTLGFLWNFRHQHPLGQAHDGLWHYGSQGAVDVSLVYQLERGGRWLHVAGRPDWLRAEEMPVWARGALYTASNPIDVGDETWLYFTGTADRHGWAGAGVDNKAWRAARAGRGGFAQIGLLKWPKDRLLGYRARLRERIELLPQTRGVEAGKLLLNAEVHGALRVSLIDAEGKALPGYGAEDMDVLNGDLRAVPVRWRGSEQLPSPAAGQQVAARIEMEDATLFAFSFCL